MTISTAMANTSMRTARERHVNTGAGGSGARHSGILGDCRNQVTRRQIYAGGFALLCLTANTAFADRGALNPDVTQATIAQTICAPGYAKGVRPATSYTNGVKQMLMQRAKMNPALAEYYELDQIIPLALGGHPRKLDNLALQLREGENGAKQKDRIEIKLQCLVCSGQVKLATAQREILEDWQAAYHKYAGLKCRRR